MYIVRGAVLICAVVLIILGISNGSMNDVLGKAVQICTECIGLG
ncbi:MAG: thioredoxin [Clostridia bacterium]|nr:thioredoxin [Clostridia bacterium]